MSDYESVIGLEVHVQLNTESKLFSSDRNRFGDPANENTSVVTVGLPGALPVFNKQVMYLSTQLGLSLNCHIAEQMKFDRKHYFYPDLPKAYQITQMDMPIAAEGFIEIEVDGKLKKIRINRAHVEEDAGKLLHEGIKDGSHVDYNRAGTPLVEIVTEPDLSTPEEAYAYLTKLKAILQYIEVSDCNMDEGSLRCDANVSIRKKGDTELGTKAEIKNLNSFKAVAKAIQYEIDRQIDLVEDGERVTQETRLWDDNKGMTNPMRSKEGAHDYRYFPEPDLVPFTISREYVEKIKKELPELPTEKWKRFVSEYKVSDYDAEVLTQDKKLADYFEDTIKGGAEAKAAANWITNELLAQMKAKGVALSDISIKPQGIAELTQLIEKGTISGKIAKDVLAAMFDSDKSPEEIVKEKGLAQISDEGEIVKIVETVIEEQPKSVEAFKSGKTNAISFLVGQVMKATKGKANPAMVNKLLQEKLK